MAAAGAAASTGRLGPEVRRWSAKRSLESPANAVDERADKPVLLNRLREHSHDPLPSEQQVS
jgi:hypothetical protein